MRTKVEFCYVFLATCIHPMYRDLQPVALRQYQLPNVGNMQIAVVYRSPCVPRATLITVLTRLLRHVTLCSIPCVILGNFNEDIVHHQNTAILALMSSFSFKQIVQYPTTSQGTLIDHVYYRNTSGNTTFAIVQMQDTYYSDHDTVYCSIPLGLC